MSCASSSSSRSQPIAGEEVDVARGDVVRGDDDVGAQGRLGERGAREPEAAVVDVHAQRGREPGDLRGPLLDHAHRADDERRPEHVRAELLPLGGEHRDRLDGLPEAHVVGQDPADAEVAEHPQPAVAALLEREEREAHRGGRRQRAEAVIAVLEQVRERRVERDLAELEPRLVRLEPADRADELDDPGVLPTPVVRRRSRNRSAFSTSDRRSACQRPATRTNGSFAAARSASSCSLRTTSPSASFQSKVASDAVERRPLDRAPTPLLVAVRLTRSLLGDPSQAPGSSTGTPRASSSGIASRRNSCTSSPSSSASAGFASSKRMPCSASSGSISVSCRARSRRASLARRKLKTSSPSSCSSEAGSPRVGSSSACSHSSSTSAVPALVEVEAELPGSRGATAEAVVEPAGEPPVERRVAGVARQLRLGSAEAVEEELERSRAAVPQRSAQPDAPGLQAVARDLVDEDGVEVAYGRVAVAAERGGRGLGERCRDLVERRLHALVEGGAPERVPGAAVVLEVGVDETLDDGALRKLDDGEGGRCAPACVGWSASRRAGSAREHRGPGSRDRPVGVTGEEGRGRVLLPDQFEHDLSG